MARIRCIKPEFWTSEQIAECSPNARLVFIGMWTFSDDSGVHPASTKRLKMEVYPADEFSDAQIKSMIAELVAAELIEEYDVSGASYWRVTGWKHQKIDQPTYKHPLPDGVVPSTPFRRRDVGERSPNTIRTNGECSPPDVDLDLDVEGKGKRGAKSPSSLLDELSQSTPIEKQVLEIAKLHPKIADPLNMSHAYQHFICEAIARHQDQVLSGTRIWAVYWKENPRFVKNVQDFFVNSEYLLTPVGTQNGPQPGYVSQSEIRRKEIAEAKAAAKA